MPSVALIMPDNPYAPNGAAAYMRRLYDNRDLAARYGLGRVELCHGGVNFTDPERYVSSLTGRVKQAVKRALARTRWGTRRAIEATMYRRGGNAVAMFGALAPAPDAVVFNDFATHDLFIGRHPGYDGLRVQILHDNGEFGKMLMAAMPKADPSWLRSVEARVLADSDVVVHVGAKPKERFDELHPECAGRSEHVHTGIDDLGANPPREGGGPLTFVAVGTVCARKNQRALLDVAADDYVRSRARFIVVGGGDEYEPCKAEAGRLGLSDAVRFVGPSSHVVDWYRQADAFISASLDEGLPTVALEAMSCGLPLVLTDVGGCAELIDGNGVLVPSCDNAAIVDGIHDFFSLYDSGRISGAASRKLFEERYTTEAMWREWAGLIQARLGAKQGGERG